MKMLCWLAENEDSVTKGDHHWLYPQRSHLSITVAIAIYLTFLLNVDKERSS